MNKNFLYSLAIIAILAVSCAAKLDNFSSERLSQKDFSQYKTYAFIPTTDTQYARMINRIALVPALQQEAISLLTAKGFSLDTLHPDCLFTYHLVVNRDYDVNRQQYNAYNQTPVNVASVPMYTNSNSAIVGSTMVRSGTAPGSNVYYYSSDNRPYAYGGKVHIDTLRQGSMVVDMIDAESKKVVWRSVLESTRLESEKLSPEDAVHIYLPKMLKKLPKK